VLATQELADLDRAARGLRDQILGNTAVKIAHRQDVAESAEAVARLAGREQVWERTYHVRPGPLGGADLRRGTLRLAERYAIEPARVQTLRTGEAVVIVKSPRSSARLTRVLPPSRSGSRSGGGVER
jgi:type IV secretory pathway TraG/TraD family ATPase VirD4